MTYSVRNIVIALVMSVAAAAAVLVYTSSYKDQVTRNQERVKVLVATRDILAGTTASDAVGAMAPREILRSDMAPGAVTSAATITGKVLTQPVYAGQQVLGAEFGTPTGQRPQLQLHRTDRGIRVNVDPASGVVGVVRAGDAVDVFASFKVKDPAGGTATVTRLLLPNVRLLEAPPIDPKKNGGLSGGGGGSGAQQVMLDVSQRDAAKLAFVEASEGSTLWLALRPSDGQATEQPVSAQTLQTLLLDNLDPAQTKALLARYGTKGQVSAQ